VRWWELTRLYAVQASLKDGVGGGRGANGFLGREVNCSAFTCHSARGSYLHVLLHLHLTHTCTCPFTQHCQSLPITANAFHSSSTYHTPSLTRSAVSHNALIIPFATIARCTKPAADSQFRPPRPRRELRQANPSTPYSYNG